jgi:hypothetical protein
MLRFISYDKSESARSNIPIENKLFCISYILSGLANENLNQYPNPI